MSMSTLSGDGNVLASSSRGAGTYTSSNSGYGSGNVGVALALINVTAVSGNPTLSIQLQSKTTNFPTFVDMPGGYRVLDPVGTTLIPVAIAAVTGDSTTQIQAVCTVDGKNTPTVEFSVSIVTFH